ncbi:nicotinate-nucleotide adenylyltransferase [Rhodoluna limnophila]|uniref:nicotinate-nucleotide adenylyltransferase n=1 Tax=Rhodoluna limnophila TaxID=232537 RepID=UPI0011062AFC|nr:nicotinate-nucleotide adenylyltransferase [Rhodoluna limnophila]
MSHARLGVMGGTFDPIHYGHLVAANEVAFALNLDHVVFVPAGQPWQKGSVSDAAHRFEMTRLAIEGNPDFSVSRVDVDRSGATYAVDTVADIASENPDAELFFITGADALADIFSWKDPERLLKLAKFIGVSRPGHKLSVPRGAEDVVTLVEVSALAISSTDIREKVRQGKPIRYLLPDSVIEYITEHRLYEGNK